MKLHRGRTGRRIRRREIIAELLRLGMSIANIDDHKLHTALVLELQELCIVDENSVGNVIKKS